jgi:hypothetical protein
MNMPGTQKAKADNTALGSMNDLNIVKEGGDY